MARFFLGFAAASALWAAVAFGLHMQGWLSFGADDDPDEVADVGPATDTVDDDEPDKKRNKRGRRGPRRERSGSAGAAVRPDDTASGAARSGAALPRGEATTGDDLDWNGDREISMNAGEEQLSGKAIEAGFDSAMGKIRRCLVLVPAEGEVKGKLTFGMRVGSDGVPRAVNLSGPAVVTGGDSGGCLRSAAQAIRFPKFSGPDMLFKYPITLQ